jgi:hypothetical protein
LEARESQPPTWWLAPYPIPRAYLAQAWKQQSERTPEDALHLSARDVPYAEIQMHMDMNTLTYLVPGEGGGPVERTAITSVENDADTWFQPQPGTLERLRQLSIGIGHEYGWTPAQAATFILTGQQPNVGAISNRLEYRSWHALPTIVLHIDPATPPVEVAEYY